MDTPAVIEALELALAEGRAMLRDRENETAPVPSAETIGDWELRVVALLNEIEYPKVDHFEHVSVSEAKYERLRTARTPDLELTCELNERVVALDRAIGELKAAL